MMQRCVIVKLLSFCHASTAVELRASAALLVTKVLSCIGSEKTCGLIRRKTLWPSIVPVNLPTDVLGIFTTSFHLGLIVWFGESFLLSNKVGARTVQRVVQLSGIMVSWGVDRYGTVHFTLGL